MATMTSLAKLLTRLWLVPIKDMQLACFL